MIEENAPDREAPLPPEQIPPAEQPEMSELGTVGNIFFEPERTFKDLKKKSRFIVGGIIIALLVTAYTLSLSYKVGEAGVRSFIGQQIDKSPQAASMSPEQRTSAIDLQMTINKYSRFAAPVFVFISFFVGGLLYWLGAKAFGGTGSFMQNVSVWVYSGLPVVVVSMIANFIVLGFKSAEDIDFAASQRGMIHANPSFFIDGKEQPMIGTFLSTFDVFAIWGWILAAIGLSVVNKMSKGSAWAVVIIITIIGLGFRLIGAVFSGTAN